MERSILPGPKVVTATGEHRFDAVIVCTGFGREPHGPPGDRADPRAIDTWASHVSPAEA